MDELAAGSENLQNPRLSVVVALVSDTTAQEYDLSHLAGCLEALYRQDEPPSMEIIVPYPAPLSGMDALQKRFAGVKFVAIDELKTFNRQIKSREHHDELRARGLVLAQGQISALLEDHARPDPRWSYAISAAHEQAYAAVGGAIENAIDRPLNWAVYFCDFGKYQNPLPAGESYFASDANISYKNSTLAAIRQVWQRSFQEPLVNGALLAAGEKLALCPQAIVYQQREKLRLWPALQERFIWGQSYAAARSRLLSTAKRVVYALLSPLLPLLLLLRMTATVMRKGRNRGAFIRAVPYTIMLLVAWSIGELTGYFTNPVQTPQPTYGQSSEVI
jgi:hypothetical protein